jgi:hypothetical protein
MSALNVILWVAGAVLLTVAVLRVRQPYGRMTELERLADNARLRRRSGPCVDACSVGER